MASLTSLKRKCYASGNSSKSAKRQKLTPEPALPMSNDSPRTSRYRSLSLDSSPAHRPRSRSVDSIPKSLTPEPIALTSNVPMTSERTDAIISSASAGRRDPITTPIYYPFRNEVAETKGLLVPGESKTSDNTRPVRNLDSFTFYSYDRRYLPFALAARCLETGAQRTILASGLVTRVLENPDDGDSDIESLDTQLLVSLQPLVDFWVDYNKGQPNSVWVATKEAWYILQEPEPLYAVFYQPFWVAHHLTWRIARAARRNKSINLTDFLMGMQMRMDDEAILIMGRDLTVKDLHGEYTILYILDQLSSPSLDDSQNLSRTPLLQDIALRAAKINSRIDDLFGQDSCERPISMLGTTGTVTMPLVYELTTGIFLTTLLKAGKDLDVEEQKHKLLEIPDRPDILHPDEPTNIEWEKPIEGHPDYFGQVFLDGEQYDIGDIIMVNPGKDDLAHRAQSAAEACSRSRNDLGDQVWFSKIIYMYRKRISDSQVEWIAHVQWYQDGAKTILQETAHPYSLFALAECEDIPVEAILGRCIVKRLQPSDPEPNSYHCRKNLFLWDAKNCRFLDHDYLDREILSNEQNANNRIPRCPSCIFNHKREDYPQEIFIHSVVHATIRGIDYHKNDFVYIAATPNSPYVIGQIHQFLVNKSLRIEDTMVELRRFGRYDDVAKIMEEAQRLSHIKKDELRLFMTERVETYPLSLLEGKCFVCITNGTFPLPADHFYVDRCGKSPDVHDLTDLMPFDARSLELCKICISAAKKEQRKMRNFRNRQAPLRTMELFAGAGGLSTGLEQSGYVKTCWAVEISIEAAATFQANHPATVVFNQDTNLCLQSAIDVTEGKPYRPLYSLADNQELPPMPQRGEVDLIAGGFPCQSFSIMNHQRHKRPDDVRTTLVANMLSYVEFYQPRYVLMENVKGLLQYHIREGFPTRDDDDDDDANGERTVKMGVVKFILRALTCLGYQAELKILDASEYGSPQRRGRVIFWAARHPNVLPEYPLPTHVSRDYRNYGLKLPTYDKLIPPRRSERCCAPFCALVVADAISDLPAFEWKNPSKKVYRHAMDIKPPDQWQQLPAVSSVHRPLTGFLEPTDYAMLPNTNYQRMMRGDQTQVTLHCSRAFVAAVVERTWYVCSDEVTGPKDLPRPLWTPVMKQASAEKLAKIWRDRFGRLRWNEPFNTALTCCRPFSKRSKNLHPKQRRILTARECARSQGFPDYYEFVQPEEDSKPKDWAKLMDEIHKQIGNAVPIPLAYALGDSLGRALYAKWSRARGPLEDHE